MVISKDKKYRTDDGCFARVYATDAGETYPIHGAVFRAGRWLVCRWTEQGKEHLGGNGPNDLVEVKPRIKRTYWINLYPNDVRGITHESKEEADLAIGSGTDRIACVKVEIDCEEGEGL